MKVFLISLAAVLLGGRAVAQPIYQDTASKIPDSLSVPYKGLVGPRFCFFDDHIINSDTAFSALKERCKEISGEYDFDKEILMFRHVGGDCHARYAQRFYLDPGRKKLVWIIYNYYGGCRAGGGRTFWVVIPKPPEGYLIEMKTYLMDREGNFERVKE